MTQAAGGRLPYTTMTADHLYLEKVISNRTEALFIGLALLFLLLSTWQTSVTGPGAWSGLCLCLFACFLFYALNYRTLVIRLTWETLKLTFGIFTWTVPLDNIEDCRLDELPALMRLGGAGIHFMLIRNRYRASFNFLEHPRVVIGFKRKAGWVRDISFSTRRPNEVLRLIQETMSTREAS